jgi:hypothetical protein
MIRFLVMRAAPFRSVGALITRGLKGDSGDTNSQSNRRRIVLSAIIRRRGRR